MLDVADDVQKQTDKIRMSSMVGEGGEKRGRMFSKRGPLCKFSQERAALKGGARDGLTLILAAKLGGNIIVTDDGAAWLRTVWLALVAL